MFENVVLIWSWIVLNLNHVVLVVFCMWSQFSCRLSVNRFLRFFKYVDQVQS